MDDFTAGDVRYEGGGAWAKGGVWTREGDGVGAVRGGWRGGGGAFGENGEFSGAEEVCCFLCEGGADYEVVEVLGEELVEGGFVVVVVVFVVAGISAVVPGDRNCTIGVSRIGNHVAPIKAGFGS